MTFSSRTARAKGIARTRSGPGVDSALDTFLAALAALTPPVGVGVLFYLAIRALVNADRNERTAMARLEAEEDARASAAASRPDVDAA